MESLLTYSIGYNMSIFVQLVQRRSTLMGVYTGYSIMCAIVTILAASAAAQYNQKTPVGSTK